MGGFFFGGGPHKNFFSPLNSVFSKEKKEIKRK